MLNRYGNIVVIGLDARKDRWKRCVEIFEKYNISPVTHYCTEIDHNDIHRHYMKDFLTMLRGITDDLVFFEDDFELTDNWQEVLEKAYNDLPEDWDMLYLGANLTRMPLKITENLMKVQGAWLMHGVIMRRKWINDILKFYDLNAIWIIDEWYRRVAPVRKFYMTYPMICYQRPDYSDVVGQYVNYDIFNNQFYKAYEDNCNGARLSTLAERRGGMDASRNIVASEK